MYILIQKYAYISIYAYLIYTYLHKYLFNNHIYKNIHLNLYYYGFQFYFLKSSEIKLISGKIKSFICILILL
jgi:hypothetical protein